MKQALGVRVRHNGAKAEGLPRREVVHEDDTVIGHKDRRICKVMDHIEQIVSCIDKDQIEPTPACAQPW
jgi:hypothetical protein